MVALFGEVDDEGRLILIHGLRSNSWTRDDLTRAVIAWCKATGWWPHVVAKQKFGEDPYLKDLGRAFLSEARPVHVKPVTRVPDIAKLDFIVEALQGPFERSEIVFGSAFPHDLRKRAEYETVKLGQVKNDDIPDTIALFYVKGVRVDMPTKHIRGHTDFVPPVLGLYAPGQPRQAIITTEGPKNPLEAALHKPTVSQFMFDLSLGSDITFDNDPGSNETHKNFGLAEWEN